MAKKSVKPDQRWVRPLMIALLGTAVILGAAAFVMSLSRPAVDRQRLDFDLVDIEGNPVSPSAQRFAGKVLLVDIWGLWCAPCIQQIPYLIELQDRYGAYGLEIVGVEFASYYGDARDQYTAALREWAQTRGVNYTIVQGGETWDVQKVFPALRDFAGFPTSILIGRDGRVELITQGFSEEEMTRFEAVIKKLLNEPKPVPQG